MAESTHYESDDEGDYEGDYEGNAVPSTVVSLLAMRAEQQPRRIGYTVVSESGAEENITYSELDRRAKVIASRLSDLRLRGQRLMLVYPSGIDYIASFFGCLYAGAIAVPACPPDPVRPGRLLTRLAAIVADAAPAAMLTTPEIAGILPSLLGSWPELSRLCTVTTDDAPAEPPGDWEIAPADAGSIAMLQYTSGSTATPRGVVLTHRNLISNSELIFRFFRHSRRSRGLTWLPPYHDMGLIGGILQPLYGGFPMTLMSPADFLRRPVKWLQEISRVQATTSGGPNFAYDLCVRKTTEEERSQLDLSSWRVAINGSEPVRADTMENFVRAFEPAGFRRDAFHPCYGLAEATLIVTGGLPWSRRCTKSFDAVPLGYGTAIPGAAEGRPRLLVSCGFVPHEGRVLIVDPVTNTERAPGEVGEIWISGDGVAQAYWRRPLETREAFGARLAATPEATAEAAPEGAGEGPFLRSGDLGFMLGRQLFVTGRIKDLIIIRGRNHYPQDIELAAERSSPALRPGRAAAFTVLDGDRERLVVAHEITAQAGDVNVAKVTDAIRAAVAADHGIGVHTVVLVPPGAIPKTSSGKVQRRLCAAMLADGQLPEVGRRVFGDRAVAGHLDLDRLSLLAVPSAERRDLLKDYLSGLVASTCGIDVATVAAADMSLLSLGIDSSAVVGIQQSIQLDLGTHLTASDLAHAASLSDLAARLDSQLSSSASPPKANEGLVRLHRWVSGARVS